MFINSDTQNPLNSLFNRPTSNIDPIQSNLAQSVEDNDETTQPNFALSSMLLNDEQQLSTKEQAKKGIIEQVIGQVFGNGQNQEAQKLYPSVEFEMQSFIQEQSSEYNQESYLQTPEGFIYESANEFYEKTTIDFSASAVINTPNGQYEIEVNFQYTKEVYERHSTAIAMNHENFTNNPLEINLDNDDDSLKGLKQLDLVFDAKKLEELEEEQKKNQALLHFIEALFEYDKTKDNRQHDDFMAQISVYERQDETFNLAAQTQNGIGMYFSHEKSESDFAHASYDSNGNFSFTAGYSSYESSEFTLKV